MERQPVAIAQDHKVVEVSFYKENVHMVSVILCNCQRRRQESTVQTKSVGKLYVAVKT